MTTRIGHDNTGASASFFHFNSVPVAAGRNFFAGFALNYVISSGNSNTALTGGIVSATASLIDSALRPILHRLFGRGFQNSTEGYIIRSVVVLALVSAVTAAVSPITGVTVVVNIAATIFVHCVLAIFEESDVGNTAVMV